MKKTIYLLAPLMVVSFLANCGCSKATKKYVTVTFDTGIGAFKDSNIIKTLTVRAGTKLNECGIDKPVFECWGLKKEIDYWSDDKGKRIIENYAITSDINLSATYYPLLDVKNMCTGIGLDALERAYGQRQTEECKKFTKDYIKTSMNYDNGSQAIGCSYITVGAGFIYIMKGDPTLILSKSIIEYINDIHDQRAQTIGKLGEKLIRSNGQDDNKDFTEFCYNQLFDFVKKVKLEYVPWADLLCDSAISSVSDAYLYVASDEVKKALSNDTTYFSNSISISKDSNTAHLISFIGANFFNNLLGHETDINFINNEFLKAKAEVEKLL